ncbi:hypothetical protein EXIGLDRAFT_706266 [Exidia glandulosa HHB12029]|uniref:Uncharacterized protein n=1 Tax=Exidia glandulosa HHB12029 TaxID=1314781 RepID=A0A165Z6M3_EXIGL|nr:hypothetical protein EXIGLDRAFT_706266 [Exidia glandulosa HHB12029]
MSRPMITYGRSSKKLLARRAAQTEEDEPAPTSLSTQTKRALPNMHTDTESPRKKAKTASTDTTNDVVLNKPRAVTSSETSPIRPSPTTRKTTTATPRKDIPTPSKSTPSAEANSPSIHSSMRFDQTKTASITPQTCTVRAASNGVSAPRATSYGKPAKSSVHLSSSSKLAKSTSTKVQADPDNVFFASSPPAASSTKRKVETTQVAAPSMTPLKRKRTSEEKAEKQASPPSHRSTTPVQDAPPPPALSRSPSKSDALSQLFGAGLHRRQRVEAA